MRGFHFNLIFLLCTRAYITPKTSYELIEVMGAPYTHNKNLMEYSKEKQLGQSYHTPEEIESMEAVRKYLGHAETLKTQAENAKSFAAEGIRTFFEKHPDNFLYAKMKSNPHITLTVTRESDLDLLFENISAGPFLTHEEAVKA